MKLELIKYSEETGFCELDADEEAKQMLIELGFNALLRKALEVYENEREEDDSIQRMVVVEGNAGRTSDS